MISILICTYNHSNFLKNCINSAIGKGEIVVVDDCSSDNTQDVLSEFPTITVIKNNTRKNLLESRKIAFEHSHGDYITFLDDDDFLHNIKESEYDLLQGKIKTNRKSHQDWYDKYLYKGEDFLSNKCHLDYHVWGKVFKRWVLEEVYKEIKMSYVFMGEDSILMENVFNKIKTYKYTDELFYTYHHGSGYSSHRELL